MSWKISAPAIQQAVEFSPGPDPSCVIRLRRLRDKEGEPAADSKAFVQSDAILDTLQPAVCERMSSHEAVYRHFNAAAERDDLDNQLARAQVEIGKLTALRKSIITQCKTNWRPRSEHLAAKIASLEAAAVKLQSAIATCDEAIAASMAMRNAAAERIVGIELQSLVEELDAERRQIMSEIENAIAERLDRLRSLDYRRRDLVRGIWKKPLITEGLRKAKEEAAARWKDSQKAKSEIQQAALAS